MISVSPRADPPFGVKVTEDMVRLVVPQFQDIPTNIKRFVPVPVVCVILILLLFATAVLLEIAPSWVIEPATISSKLAAIV